VIWPFAPFGEFTEGLEFLTDVLSAYAEDQRIQLTAIPRRRFEHSYVWTARQYERARNLMRGQHPGEFEVPDWSDFRRCVAVAGVTSLSFDNTSPELDETMNLVLWQDDETYEELSVLSSSAAGLTLGIGLANSYPNGRVLRLLNCDTLEGLSAEHPAGPTRSSAVEWVCYEDTLPTADVAAYSSYRSEPLLDACPIVGADALPETVARVFQMVDNGIARPFVDSLRGVPTETLGLAWQPHTRAEAWALRRALYSLRGRQRAFWLPSFNHGGMELAAGFSGGAGSISIRDVNYAIGYGAGDLYVQLVNGTAFGLRVASAIVSGANETLTLSGTTPQAVSPSQVKLLCALKRMRLSQDRVEWRHRPAVGSKVVVAAADAPEPA
jgi:hypothetical protein